MIDIEVDSAGLVQLACRLLAATGYPSLEPVVRSGLSIADGSLRFRIGPALTTATIAAVDGCVKLTLQKIEIAGISVSRVARRPVRKRILAKLALGKRWIEAKETPDANIDIAIKDTEVESAAIGKTLRLSLAAKDAA